MKSLENRLKSSDEDEVIEAIQSLGHEDWSAERLDMVIEIARESDEFLVGAITEQLETVPQELEATAGKFLAECLQHESEMVRSDAAESLGVLGYNGARLPLEQSLKSDGSELVRADAAVALGALAQADSVVPVRKAAREDASSLVRAAAAAAFGRCSWDDPPADASEIWRTVQTEEEILEVLVEWTGTALRWEMEPALLALETLIKESEPPLVDNIVHMLEDLSQFHPPQWISDDYWPNISVLLAAHSGFEEYHEFVLDPCFERLQVATTK